jgi:serine protease Do
MNPMTLGSARGRVKREAARGVARRVVFGLAAWIAAGVPAPAHAGPWPRRDAVVEVVERVSPAVVNIRTEEVLPQRANPFYAHDPLFDDFFRMFIEPRTQSERTVRSLGTGVVIDASGIVLTNEHVVARATSIKVGLSNGAEHDAEVVAADPRFDLAVLRVQATGPLPAAAMGRSADLMPGETVIAIGNPFGLEHTVTVGVVSAVRRSIKASDREFHEFIQTDASINPGNSGGPLLNINGEVIAINTAIHETGQGIGFAIPIDKARRVVDELLRFGKVRPVWLGIVAQDLDDELRAHFRNAGRAAVLVSHVEEGSPAAAAGMRPGDVIEKYGGARLQSAQELHEREARQTAGDRVEMEIVRGDERVAVTVQVAAFPVARALQMFRTRLGLVLRGPTEAELRVFRSQGIRAMVVERVDTRGIAARIGIRPGDLITSIGGAPVEDDDALAETMARFRAASAIPLVVRRGRTAYRVNIPLR